MNRGNGRAAVFHGDEDYAVFVRLLYQGWERLPMRVLAYCLMPNHFHMVLWPRDDGDLSCWMQWLLTAHVRHHHREHGTGGHVWEGRFKAFPIQQDEHLLTVLQYVERNPARAGLVKRAQDWQWSSLRWWNEADRPAFMDEGPVERPGKWAAAVNRAMSEEEFKALRQSVNRGTPFGTPLWQRRTAARLGLESSLRPRGRPRKPGTAS